MESTVKQPAANETTTPRAGTHMLTSSVIAAHAKSKLQHGTAALPLPAHGVLSNANPHDSSGPRPGRVELRARGTPL